jgi:chromosomal replication initiator protein
MENIDGTAIHLRVPDRVFVDWIQNNYGEIIEEALVEVGLSGHSLHFEVSARAGAVAKTENHAGASPASLPPAQDNDPTRVRPHPAAARTRYSEQESSELLLNQKYTFETFVVGSSNQFAHAAALAVAEGPSRTYNPLYLYGGVGLGKTHLMCAIGHRVKERNRHLRLCYISAERFMNELINAIRYEQTLAFRDRYRSIDVLLIDDIQFIAGKERTQEEFFHTFNALHDAHKQIVLTCDRPASEIQGLEQRLISRFEWGMTADLKAPDVETRLAILNKKAAALSVRLPDPIIMFLANRIRTNVRRLEGALVRVAAYAQLSGKALDLETVETLLREILQEEGKVAISVSEIQKRVADYFDIRLADMTSKRRPENIAFPRQIAMYLTRQLTEHSLSAIGESFGGRDHGTVLHACRQVRDRMEVEAKVRQDVGYLEKQLTR